MTTAGWQLQWQEAPGGPVATAALGSPLSADITTLARVSATPSGGTRVEVRGENRSGTHHATNRLTLIIPRASTSAGAMIDGVACPVPCEVRQEWHPGGAAGSMHGFYAAIRNLVSGQVLIERPVSTVPGTPGGKTSGIIRIDGFAYCVPWWVERNPRAIRVLPATIEIDFRAEPSTIAAAASPPARFMAGEDCIDIVAVLPAGLADAQVIAEAEGLPTPTAAVRAAAVADYGVVPYGLADTAGLDAETKALLTSAEHWLRCPWDIAACTLMPSRTPAANPGGLWTLDTFEKLGGAAVPTAPGVYRWNLYGQILWGDGASNGHYDWLAAALAHYLRTGDLATLRWAVQHGRNKISTGHCWPNPTQPSGAVYRVGGLSRYEKGVPPGGGPPPAASFPPQPSHTWSEGLWLLWRLTGDEWVREAAVQIAETLVAYWGAISPTSYRAGAQAEIRMASWSLLNLTCAYRETKDARYLATCKLLWAYIRRGEVETSGHAPTPSGRWTVTSAYPATDLRSRTTPLELGLTYPLQNLYLGHAIPAWVALAEAQGAWTAEDDASVRRFADWLRLPVAQGGCYCPPGIASPDGAPADPQGGWPFKLRDPWVPWCPYSPTLLKTEGKVERAYYVIVAPFAAFCAKRYGGAYVAWARDMFRLAMTVALEPGPGLYGFALNGFPGSETKVLGWMARSSAAALYAAGSPVAPPPPPPPPVPQPVAIGSGTIRFVDGAHSYRVDTSVVREK